MLLNLLSRLWRHISRRRRSQLLALLMLMVAASFAEVLSIGAVIPFLGVLSSPEYIFNIEFLRPYIQHLGIASASQLLIPCALLFGVSAVVAGGMRLLLLWVSTRLAAVIGSDLSNAVYRCTLYQSYSVHVLQ